MSLTTQTPVAAPAMRLFHVEISQAETGDLCGRIAATRRPEPRKRSRTSGMNEPWLASLQELVRYWGAITTRAAIGP
jgi:hypothetical protein